VFTRSARQQFSSGRPPNNDQSDFFFHNFGEEFMNEQPSTLLEYLWYYTLNLTLMVGTVLFFLLMLSIALFQLFPNLFYAFGGILVFLLIFSPGTLNCCCKNKNEKKTKMKNHNEKNDKNENKAEIDMNKEILIPIIKQKDIEKKGYISVIAVNDKAYKHCVVLQPRYKKDPFLFYQINHIEKFIDTNDGLSSTYVRAYDVVAVSKGGERWTGLLFPPATTSGYSNEGIYGTRRSHISAHREFIDVWLLKLLGGEINWTLTVNEMIPDGLIECLQEE